MFLNLSASLFYEIQPYFDLAWLHLNRTRDYGKALPFLKAIVNPPATLNGKSIPDVEKEPGFKFAMLRPGDKGYDYKDTKDKDAPNDETSINVNETKWRASREGNRLAYCYRKLGVVLYGESKLDSNSQNKETLLAAAKSSFEKAIAAYKFAGDPKNGNGNEIALVNMKEVAKSMNDPKWLDSEWEAEKKLRTTYGLPEDPGILPSAVQ